MKSSRSVMSLFLPGTDRIIWFRLCVRNSAYPARVYTHDDTFLVHDFPRIRCWDKAEQVGASCNDFDEQTYDESVTTVAHPSAPANTKHIRCMC